MVVPSISCFSLFLHFSVSVQRIFSLPITPHEDYGNQDNLIETHVKCCVMLRHVCSILVVMYMTLTGTAWSFGLVACWQPSSSTWSKQGVKKPCSRTIGSEWQIIAHPLLPPSWGFIGVSLWPLAQLLFTSDPISSEESFLKDNKMVVICNLYLFCLREEKQTISTFS